MYLNFPNGPILVDGQKTISDLKLNVVPETAQMRIKFRIDNDLENRLVDIVVFNYSLPHLEKTSLVVTASGKEMETDEPFRARLSFNFIKRRWTFKGRLNARDFEEHFPHILGIVEVLSKIYEVI